MLTSLSEDFAVVTTWIGVRPPKNSPTGPHSPPSIFACWNRCRNAHPSSCTRTMDNNGMTVMGLRRLFLFTRLEGRRFRPRLRLLATPKHGATDIDVGNVALPLAPFCSTALWRPPTPRQLGAMVWPSPAAWQVGSAHWHSGQQQRDDDQVRRGDNPTTDHWQQLQARPACTLPPQQRQLTRCLVRTVQLLQRKCTQQERFNNNPMIRRETLLKLQFQWRLWNQH